MPKAREAPFALVDIVRCSKSRNTGDAGRQAKQCSPRCNAVPRTTTRKKKTLSSRGSLPKNLIVALPVQGSQAMSVPEAPALSVRAEERDEDSQMNSTEGRTRCKKRVLAEGNQQPDLETDAN